MLNIFYGAMAGTLAPTHVRGTCVTSTHTQAPQSNPVPVSRPMPLRTSPQQPPPTASQATPQPTAALAHAAVQDGAVAPPAPVWENWLQSRKAMAVVAAAASNAASTSGDGGGARPESFNSYADAVIAGLSPYDEAVQLSHLAAASGQTLQDLLDFNYSASTSGATGGDGSSGGAGGDAAAGDDAARDPFEPPRELPAVEGEEPERITKMDTETGEYSFCADYCPRQRRLMVKQREPEGPGALYGELMRWCDPVELERSLQVRAPAAPCRCH